MNEVNAIVAIHASTDDFEEEKMPRHAATLVACAVLSLTACSRDATAPVPSVHPQDALLAKPSGPADPTATFYIPLADAGLGVRSDGLSGVSGNSVYANGVCGVAAKIFATTQYSNSGDATMQTNKPNTKDRNCTPRTVTVVFGDGVSTTGGVFMNVRQIANTSYTIPIGTTVGRTFAITESRCDGLRWVPVLADGTVTGADMVQVTRTGASTWRVQTQPAPNNKAYCVASGQLYNISVDLTVGSSYPLP